MWYFAWVLGIVFAIQWAILNAMWGENEAARTQARAQQASIDGLPRQQAG